MKIDIRSPKISGDSEEKLRQISSYLHQLRDQLQWAFENITADSSETVLLTKTAEPAAQEADALGTFAALKGLIIKSADIVNAYSDEITSRLEGTYVAVSDFGTYQQETAQQIRQTSTEITQLFGNFQQISSAVMDIQSVLTNAYIKTGLLYEDREGAPVYGLEIGQTNEVNGQTVFSRFARFCSGRLSFYDSNDTEIAFISDYKLYITNAEITGSLRVANRFRIYYNNGLAFQWTGGEG